MENQKKTEFGQTSGQNPIKDQTLPKIEAKFGLRMHTKASKKFFV